MKIIIRPEKSEDYNEVFNVVKEAFQNEELSDHKEHHLVNRLRKSKSFIPELSIVAEYENTIIGHILITRVKIVGGKKEYDSLALAPVSVLPKFQRKGVGGLLIKSAHETAKSLGYKSILVLGHEKYYPKFGYVEANHFGIEFPFDVPGENCMAIELTKNGLKEIKGVVEYPQEFYSLD